MTLKLSTGLRDAMVGSMGFAGAFNRGSIKIFSGSQPANADAAETGTLLGTVTASSGALTKETRATGSVTITGVGAGTINTITVGGLNIIPDGAVTITASDTTSTAASKLCDAINRNGIMEARVAAAVVTLRGRPGTHVTTAAVTGSLTTVTASYVNMGSGVTGVASVNSLFWLPPNAGVIAKSTDQVWSFNGAATGTAGWFRVYSSDTADSGALLSGAPWYPRLDGSVGTSGADLNLASTSIVSGAPNTIDQFQFTMPSSA
jgi:hypothetical protein